MLHISGSVQPIHSLAQPAVQEHYRSDVLLLIALAAVRLIFHFFTNHQYGYHRDELAMLDDARYLAWGYVSYPPLTPAIGRMAMELFGPSQVAVRFFSGLAQAAAMVVTGLMARELGGSRWAQVVAALAVAAAPISMIQGALFQYVSFDYLWWVLAAYFLIRLLKTDDGRWWLAIGATLGLGMMTKYNMGFFIAGIVGGVLLTPARKYLRSGWLWAGVGVLLLIFLPNLIWQVQHDFISLQFLTSIHERDVRIGRASGYLVEQLVVNASPLTVPLWIGGLFYYFFSPTGKRYRLLGWAFVLTFAILWAVQGRSYYLGGAYPMLLAGGAVAWEEWLRTRPAGQGRGWRVATGVALAVSLVLAVALMTPIAPVNSPLWDVANEVHDNFREELGWHELVATVAGIYQSLPEAERAETAIFAGNYGEAGAINLYGPAYGLPRAISPVNSMWMRGYGDPPPKQVIMTGVPQEGAERYFAQCRHVGRITNEYGVENEESQRPDIWLCREPRWTWEEMWVMLQNFG